MPSLTPHALEQLRQAAQAVSETETVTVQLVQSLHQLRRSLSLVSEQLQAIIKNIEAPRL